MMSESGFACEPVSMKQVCFLFSLVLTILLLFCWSIVEYD